MDPEDRLRNGGGAWREMLACWDVPTPSAQLELTLRREFRQRRRARTMTIWGSWAAVVALAASGVVALRGGGALPRGGQVEPRQQQPVLVSISGNQVATELDLRGFEPVQRPRLTRPSEVVSEADLDGFEPIRTMTLTRWSGGGRP